MQEYCALRDSRTRGRPMRASRRKPSGGRAELHRVGSDRGEVELRFPSVLQKRGSTGRTGASTVEILPAIQGAARAIHSNLRSEGRNDNAAPGKVDAAEA